MSTLFHNMYAHRKVLVTGHSGFKGSWLVFWLQKLGAEVFGYSLEPPTKPNHISLFDCGFQQMTADIRDSDVLYGAVKNFKPEIVFHLAARPLVRESYQNPVETFETNVMGTLNVFEACRKVDAVRAVVNITSDKCYENQERVEGYREHEPMGGHDPYSCSKGCAELLTTSYRKSFFSMEEYGNKHHTLLGSCRAGNVIGGGDWAEDRLIPDVVRAVEKKQKVSLRNPDATRPWQHVLEPLSGYLLLGQLLLEGKKEFAQAWNFGPRDGGVRRVLDVIKMMAAQWDEVGYEINSGEHPHEAMLLQLNCEKAEREMRWHEVWDIDKTIARMVSWYKAYYENGKILSADDLDAYVTDAAQKGLVWAQ